MDYSEVPPPAHLCGLIKARWTLVAGGKANSWLVQQATPDGCVEVIRRIQGRSRWDGEQPEAFVVGLVRRPQRFEITGDAAFEGLRLWPWAWTKLGEIALPELFGKWHQWSALEFDEIGARLASEQRLNALGRAIVASPTVAEMQANTGMGPRALQRWFARDVGLPARTYLQFLRFQNAFASLPGEPSLADHAAVHGFADQAHMSREFRSRAGVTARTARQRSRGPFIV